MSREKAELENQPQGTLLKQVWEVWCQVKGQRAKTA